MTEVTNMSTMYDKTIQIDVEIYADIVCPWCFIGKRRLDAAFARRPHITPRYIWRCFLLNPNMPADGMNRQAYLHAKFGDSAQAVYGRIAEAGLDSGINFNFDAISKDNWAINQKIMGDHQIGLRETGKYRPHELGQHNTRVSFNKGCFKGQEIIARMEYLGKLKKLRQAYII